MPLLSCISPESVVYSTKDGQSNQHSLNPWLFTIYKTILLTNRDLKRARANNNACKHRVEIDKLGRSNVNKRGPKTKNEDEDDVIPSPYGYSNLKSGVTCKRPNIITLSNGVQCLEGSQTHLNYLYT